MPVLRSLRWWLAACLPPSALWLVWRHSASCGRSPCSHPGLQKAVMNWWNANRQDVPRTVTMYLSGQRRVKDVVRLWRLLHVAVRS